MEAFIYMASGALIGSLITFSFAFKQGTKYGLYYSATGLTKFINSLGSSEARELKEKIDKFNKLQFAKSKFNVVK